MPQSANSAGPTSAAATSVLAAWSACTSMVAAPCQPMPRAAMRVSCAPSADTAAPVAADHGRIDLAQPACDGVPVQAACVLERALAAAAPRVGVVHQALERGREARGIARRHEESRAARVLADARNVRRDDGQPAAQRL